MKKDDIIRLGREVLEIEAQAVQEVVQQLGESFIQAVELLAECPSRVIVTGMGKSGLVGRKIAATLSSCGTPAIFIHPAEAGHGDLGMILKQDIIIAISYSGETKEIIDLLDFFKRIGVKLICVTGNPSSRLARYSDIVLCARVSREAEPTGLVPTASSTATLALGDALAVALMRKKGFTEEDFARVHPKGQIGKKLLKIKDLMHRGQQIPMVNETTPMAEVLAEMSRKKLGMTCVVDAEERLVGIITDGDLRRKLQLYGAEMIHKTARDCMTPDPKTISRHDLATKALNLMEENKITSLIVVDRDRKIEGIIHLHDLWRTEMF
ncbi:MAG: KpsF/GutQ family sugar-phosphate isomerase [Candidatus Aminicenantes bacterium 4484_214]|nr:MAG: KpsF/GutQ family sugar-phosphate isomerase [Candidatus Aminicenantes bacterium 4484_214]